MSVLAPPSPDTLPDPSMPKPAGFKIPDLSEPVQPDGASPEGTWPMPALKDQISTPETDLLGSPVELIPQGNNIQDIGNVAVDGALPKWMTQRLLPHRTWPDGTPRYHFIDSEVPLDSFPGWQMTKLTRKISRIPDYMGPETPISVTINKNKLKNEKPVKKQKPVAVHQEPKVEILEPIQEPVETLRPELKQSTPIDSAKQNKRWVLAGKRVVHRTARAGVKAAKWSTGQASNVREKLADKRVKSLSNGAHKAREKSKADFNFFDKSKHMLGTDAKKMVVGRALKNNLKADMKAAEAQGRTAQMAERRAKLVKVTSWAAPWPAPNPRTFVASARPEAAAKAPQSADELRLETVLKLKDAGERKLVTELIFDHDDPDLIEHFLVVQAEHLSDEAKNILAHDRDQKIARHNLEAQNNIFS